MSRICNAPKSSHKKFFLNREQRELRERIGFFAWFVYFAVFSASNPALKRQKGANQLLYIFILQFMEKSVNGYVSTLCLSCQPFGLRHSTAVSLM